MQIAFLVAFVGVMVLLQLHSRTQRTRRRSTLARLAEQLRGTTDGSSSVSGTHAGVRVVFRYAARGSGSSKQYWSEVDAGLPPAFPVSINVRRHGWSDRGQIERGTMVDVQLGDTSFDEQFLVEAAPADVARFLIDSHTRSFLASHTQVELVTVAGDGPVLRLAIQRWFENVDDATTMVDVVARVAGRVREAFAAVDPATASTARIEEVASVETLRARRAAREDTVNTFVGRILLAVVVAGLIAAMVSKLL